MSGIREAVARQVGTKLSLVVNLRLIWQRTNSSHPRGERKHQVHDGDDGVPVRNHSGLHDSQHSVTSVSG